MVFVPKEVTKPKERGHMYLFPSHKITLKVFMTNNSEMISV
jgi:hypothetical protein